MTDKKEIVPFDKTFVRIAKDLGRALKWVMTAASKEDNRPALTLLRVDPRKGKYGHGVVMAADGIRLHIVQGINTGTDKEDDKRPWLFDERLDLPEGNYEVRTMLQAREHINEFWEVSGQAFPDVDSVVPSRNSEMKPVALVPINPELLIDAMQNAKRNYPVYIRIFLNKTQIDDGDIVVKNSIEVISKDRYIDDIQRLAVVMPMHTRDAEIKAWPATWDGWSEDEEEEEKKDA